MRYDIHSGYCVGRAGILLLVWFAIPVLPYAGAQATSDATLETIRRRLIQTALDGAPPRVTDRVIDTQKPDGSWPGIDYTDQTRSGWRTFAHVSLLSEMARAYCHSQSKLRGSQRLRDAIDRGLQFWLEHDFRNPNWWWNTIGVPHAMSQILLLMEDQLPPTQLARGLQIVARAKIGMTGQNLVWVTETTAVRGVLQRDRKLVATAYRRIADEIRISSGEGIQADYSFHQHGACLYNHGYGAGFATDCAAAATMVVGTDCAFSDATLARLTALILDGSQWMAHGAASDFGAEGRELTRPNQDASYLGRAATDLVKVSTARHDELRALISRITTHDGPPLIGNRHFFRSDIMTHHGNDYYVSARMVSDRNANTDGPANGEGLKSHHLADGCTVIMCSGREYAGIFPVWDWEKIPGTTVVQTGTLTGSPRHNGKRSFVGGASDGQHGVAAMDFADHDLTARKSWFFFEGVVACLGADITCQNDKFPVVTTINQCLLNGPVRVATGTGVQSLDSGTHDLRDVQAVWHDAVAYELLTPAAVQLANTKQSGSWSKINQKASSKTVSHLVFRMSIDHGIGPQAATYAYCIRPNSPLASLLAADRPTVEIAANRRGLQAVFCRDQQMGGAAFYSPGSCRFGPDLSVRVSQPCIVLVHWRPGGRTLSVANPKNKPLAVEVELVVAATTATDSKAGDRDVIRRRIQLPDGMLAGKTMTESW